ncbi:MAG: DUF4956 domain-containing protein [Caldilineae bacterium]|nr:DUF4956 domain-containing protein [Chloroflexota bacterium]MCB9176804.1 DUF4956 domain-containing protein [Caldilineae bacterium]
MDSLMNAQDLLSTQVLEVPVLDLLFNLLLAALLSSLVAEAFVRWGEVLSNRRAFARNFAPIALTTTLIITVVKSSLALSLGLVGALSIIRFRTAIKDPQELAFLFLAISIGLGFGADQRLVTTLSALVILGIIGLRARPGRGVDRGGENLYLNLASRGPGGADLPAIAAALARHCVEVDLKRFDASGDGIEAAFLVSLTGLDGLDACRAELQGLDPAMRLVFVDQEGLGGLD